MKNWLKDKWAWLKTFNQVPVVIITADTIIQIGDGPAITTKGRVEVEIHVETLMIEEDE